LVILVLLLITEIGEVTPTVLVVGVMSYLLFYVLALIRDLDNPFEYRGGKPGAADVNLEVLEHSEDRLRGLLTTLAASA
jgi:predicted membrane chloride channel (bestrophin family)